MTDVQEQMQSRLDRQMLDRREAVDEWMEASASLQRCYVDWMIRSFRVLYPQLPALNNGWSNNGNDGNNDNN